MRWTPKALELLGWPVPGLAEALEAPLDFVATERARLGIERILPPAGKELAALEAASLSSTRVVLLGQDPYPHDAAIGLSFAVAPGASLPVSARSILDELVADGFGPRPDHFDLRPWASRGVLLLNSILSVERGTPGSHAGRGWEAVLDLVLRALLSRSPTPPPVFLALGGFARDAYRAAGVGDFVFAPHPAARDGSFRGSKPFSRTNAALAARGLAPVDFRLPSGSALLADALAEPYRNVRKALAGLRKAAEDATPYPGTASLLPRLLGATEALSGVLSAIEAVGKEARGIPDPTEEIRAEAASIASELRRRLESESR